MIARYVVVALVASALLALALWGIASLMFDHADPTDTIREDPS